MADLCSACSHAVHGDGPCAACVTAGDTCWQKINIVGGDGNSSAAGLIEMATGLEQKPCCMCRSWEDVDKPRLIRHMIARGLKPNARGNFETPIALDFVGRKSLELDPKTCGYCRKDGIVTDGLASCPSWTPTRTQSEFAQRMMRRRS